MAEVDVRGYDRSVVRRMQHGGKVTHYAHTFS